jgi:protein-disulfide isomerase
VSYAVAPPPTHAATPTPTGGAIPVGPPGSLVVYEYSDYLCPFCAAIHTRERSIVAKRPDVRLVRRFFPLDATCNPGINTTVHEGACDLARGAICAEKQGRFDAYDDAAFANQATHPGPEDLAAQIGLDAAAFRACLGAPDTQERLRTDGLSGKQLGVHFTPAFLVQGKVQSADEFLARLGLSSELARP